jgi:enoyl-CoA hydratase/carnithine racemase
MVVASPKAEFAVPEVLRGLYADAGGLARVVRNDGMQIGTELALPGRRITAEEAQRFNLINRISATPDSVLEEALGLAKQIASSSPDAVIMSWAGVREA